MSALRLIFNGDDYGRAASSNLAVGHAHEQGVLTSASLMVTGEAVARAVDYARAHPALAVGLHLAMTATCGALPASQAPHLLDALGRLPRDPARAGIACFFAPAVRRELRRELVAQFERFRDTGLVLSHVDSHHLMHLHPTVFPIVVALAEQYGAHGLRLPRDDLRRTLQLDRSQAAGKASWAAIYALLCRLAHGRLASSPVTVADRVYGLLQSGSMHEAFVAGLVRRIPRTVSSAEVYLHPSTQTYDGPYGPNPGDLATLLSPRVRQAIDERGAQLATYPALRSSSQRRVVCPGH
ncbi:MAG TPA: hopanoid biosynthesis-associated protein HpnK [Anaerolineae bacterium]|nr:hopanoid biosynthesis-associated protein HpnK [Anaerolineae bacterium]HOQ99401.1 hopanoid biosynthesis-associated protein HpnK [Anaerolineae bacterium]HPL27805.1 hopanoid biosynthesis-associated protein HpnK [Anaerolineae bacterium]